MRALPADGGGAFRTGRRMFLRGLAGCALSGLAFGAAALNVRTCGARGDGVSDDSDAFRTAFARSRHVHVPEGRYLVNELAAPSGLTLWGDRRNAELIQAPAARYLLSVNPGTGGSSDALRNTRDVTLRGLTFQGRVAELGFAEHCHLLNINACSNLLVENCALRGFRGDGLYIGSGNAPGVERHNRRITVRNCLFDGINGDNRNGISVIDCEGLTVENCRFVNCTRPDMPGAIDIEPDPQPFHHIANIRIMNNFIENCGGVGAICFISLVNAYTRPPGAILISGNTIHGNNGKGNGIALKCQLDGGDPPAWGPILVTGNEVLRTAQPFLVSGLRNVRMASNFFSGSLRAGVVSHPNHGPCDELVFARNRFYHLGMDDDCGVRIFPSRRVRLEDNVLLDCGRAGSPAIRLPAAGGERIVQLRNRTVDTRRHAG